MEVEILGLYSVSKQKGYNEKTQPFELMAFNCRLRFSLLTNM